MTRPRLLLLTSLPRITDVGEEGAGSGHPRRSDCERRPDNGFPDYCVNAE
jgi:hypothetical protein